MSRYRVLDMAEFYRLNEKNARNTLIGRRIDCAVKTVQHLKAGMHWQQDPDKVAAFNATMGGKLDPKTGVPTREDLEKFGAKQGTITKKGIVGVAQPVIVPETVDSRYFAEQLEKKIAELIGHMTEDKMAAAGVRELSTAISQLIEKRALLRNEPTQIVSHEQRMKLEELVPELIAEVKKRGMVIDGFAKELEPAKLVETA